MEIATAVVNDGEKNIIGSYSWEGKAIVIVRIEV